MGIKQLAGLIMTLGMTVVYSCKKHYAPPAITADHSYLVVEGVISAGGDSTIIKLSRTIQVSAVNKHRYEVGAKVSINDDQGASYPLPETDSGKYTALPIGLNTLRKYKLNIVTADGKTYESDFVPVQVTPPIDSLGYDIAAAGINIYINAHDPSNQTKYYRWDYTETYVYQSAMADLYEFDDSQPHVRYKFKLRTPEEQIHICYDTQDASTVLLRSTSDLSQSVVNKTPITQIASTSEKIYHRYSIVVKQYAITADAFNFWNQVKKNTEQIGTIFDALPSEIPGNVHCTSNPAEPVIGYVSAGTVAQKRIFIDRNQLPLWPIIPSTAPCGFQTLTWTNHNIPTDITSGVWYPDAAIIAGWDWHALDSFYSVKTVLGDCVDCRLHNHGVTVQPAFWK
jgi:hypothetical protein